MNIIKGIIFLGALTLVLSCGNGGNDAGKGTKVPLDSQVGWTPALIDTLIACTPNPGEVCDCVIPKITTKYTPDQVHEKSPYVAADMLSIRHSCEGGGAVNSVSPPTATPPGPYYYPSLKGENCETGDHGFSSKEELCDLVLNEELNHNCAREAREDLYKKLCH